MKFEELFSNADDETIEKISEKYNVLSKSEKERIFSRIQIENKSEAEDETYEISVSGVEVYERRKPIFFMKYAVAAALVLGIGSAAYMNLRHNYSNVLEKFPVTSVSEKKEISDILSEGFSEAANLFLCGTDDTEKEAYLYFYNYSNRNPDWKGENIKYRKVLDSRINTREKLFEMFESCVTEEYLMELENDGGEIFDGGLFSLTESGSFYDYPTYLTFGEELYCAEKETIPLDFNNADFITDESLNSFTAVFEGETEYRIQIVLEGGKWLINNIEKEKK